MRELSTEKEPSFSTLRQLSWLAPWLFATLTLAVVLSARHGWIMDYGSSLAFWDQWDSEAAKLIKPQLEGTMTTAGFLAPHNEHRIVLHRLWTLFALNVNEERWDNVVSALGMAVLWASFLATMVLIWGRQLATAWMLPVLACLFAINGLPYAWESLTISLQTTFLQFVALTVTAIHATTGSRLTSFRVAIAVITSIAAMGTIASSLITPVVSAAGVVVRWWTIRTDLRNSVVAVCLLSLVAMFGLTVMHVVPGHASMKAQTSSEFITAMGVALSWPIGQSWALVPWLWLPWIALSLVLLRGRPPLNLRWRDADRLFVVLGLFVWIQAAAIAYSRGHGMHELGTRYVESIAIGVLVNVYALWRWVATSRQSAPLRAAKALLAALLTTALILSLNQAAGRARPHIDSRAEQYRVQQQQVATYVNRGDLTALRGQPHLAIPYPNPDRLAALLDDPTIRATLPAVVRERVSVCDLLSAPANDAPLLLHFLPQNCQVAMAELVRLGIVVPDELPHCDDPGFLEAGLRTAIQPRPQQSAGTDDPSQKCRASTAAASVEVATLSSMGHWLQSWRAPRMGS